MGWLNIYAVTYDSTANQSIFDIGYNPGKQLLWISTSLFLVLLVLLVDFKFYETFAYIIYIFGALLLISVLFFGTEIAGSRSWFQIGEVNIQPSEFMKIATALTVAKYLRGAHVRMTKPMNILVALLLIILPASLIILQGDAGSALVYVALVLAMYREGLPNWILFGTIGMVITFVLTLFVPQMNLIIGIILLTAINLTLVTFFFPRYRNGTTYTLILIAGSVVLGLVKSVDYFVNKILKPHQQNRIKALLNPEADPLGYGWNVTQSKIAIGSGGFRGKGFLNGTQTKFDFVPEQSTDFIFCTIGEEHGWIGSFLIVALFTFLILRLVFIAERQKFRFARVYGYCVVSILFCHFMVNIGMTIGVFPVIGIPLPFFSYGGSSLWGFTLLLFIFLKLDAHRGQMLMRL